MDINLWKLIISDFKFDKPPYLSYHKGPVVIYRGEFPRYREELKGGSLSYGKTDSGVVKFEAIL